MKIGKSISRFPAVATKKQPWVSIRGFNIPPADGPKSIEPLNII